MCKSFLFESKIEVFGGVSPIRKGKKREEDIDHDMREERFVSNLVDKNKGAGSRGKGKMNL